MSENSNSFKFVFIMVATDMLKSLEEAFDEAWDLVNSEDGWKEEHKDKGTDTFFCIVIESTHCSDSGVEKVMKN